MLRTFNYTGRKRIEQSAVKILVDKHTADTPSFSAQMSLPEGLPSHCRVYVEAYKGITQQRFAFGTVGSIKPPSDTKITEVDLSGRILFRVRVVDESSGEGKLVAAADQIQSRESLDTDVDSLIPIETADLGQVPWRLDIPYEDVKPVLLVNKEIPDAINRFKSDPLFLGLVMPSILKQILVRYLLVTNEDEDENQVREKWLEFAKSIVAQPEFTDEEEKIRYIDEVVDVFCAKFSMRSLIIESMEGAAE